MGSKNKNQKTCYIYTRVSTAMQVDGYSLEAQEERLRKEAKHRGYKVIGVYQEEGKSGKNIVGRKVFQQMLDDIRDTSKDTPDYVYVFKLSRFGRNAADTLSSLQFLEDFGVSLLCVEDGIDSAGAAGKLLIAVYAAVAEAERENILAQTMAGRYQKARDGKWNGGFAPYGYKLVDGELKIEESEAEAIRLIFDKYTNGNLGINSVAKWMNDCGYKKIVRKNGTLDKFSSHFVKLILDNPVYAGYIAYGRRKTEKIDGTRNEFHIVKQDEYDLFEGQHEAIIDRELWERTKAKRALNAFKREKTHSLEHAHVLSGIVKCPRCGAPMYGVVNRKKKKGSEEYYTDMWYYICKNRKNVSGHLCDYKTHIRQDVINEQVEAVVKEALKNADFSDDVLKTIGAEENIETLQKDLQRLNKERSKEEAKKSKLLAKIMALDPADEQYDALYDDLQGLVRDIAVNISNYDENIYKKELAIANATSKQVTAEDVFKYMKALVECFDYLPEEDEQKIMNGILDAVELHEQKKPNGMWVKKIRFKVPLKFPDGSVYDEVEFIDEDSLPNVNHDETVILMSNRNIKPDGYIKLEVNTEELDAAKSGISDTSSEDF